MLPTMGGRGILSSVTVAFVKSKESALNHIALDQEDEAVKRFVLSLPADANGPCERSNPMRSMGNCTVVTTDGDLSAVPGLSRELGFMTACDTIEGGSHAQVGQFDDFIPSHR